MCDLHTEAVLQHISAKLNVIFCDREFVCSVAEDLKLLARHEGRRCVLVFPVLGAIFHRALRHQAALSNLAAFPIGAGRFRTLAVCSERRSAGADASPVVEMSVNETKERRRTRPAMQLYVPPAQRRGKGKSETKKIARCAEDVVAAPTVAVECDKAESEVVEMMEKGCVLSAKVSRETAEETNTNKTEKRADPIIITTKADNEVDREKEEMRRATERINRKSRSIIKYIDNTDTLKIEVESKPTKGLKPAENLTNWEDMFDEEGELKEIYLEEIVKQVGNEVTIIKTSEDYSPYQNNKALEDLEHVIELYNFPSSLKTCDIMQLYSEIQCDTMYVKWVDDTHALLVLSTPAQAQRALHIETGLVKSRPISEASTASQAVAFKHDLRPAMKRPQTSLQTARRLITTHLGAKSTLSREALEQERKLLREAREQRRLERQNERDAWEGNPRPSTA